MPPIISAKRTAEHGKPKLIVAAIISYSMLIPIVFLDITIEIYHRICFWIYGLPYVKRRSYISIDRGSLEYLGFWDKINCVYCGYANGFIHYAYKIMSETEKYWCPIKHESKKRKIKLIAPPHHKDFVKFGDEEALRKLYSSKSKKQ